MPTWKSELKSKPGLKFVFANVSFLIPDLIVGIPISKARLEPDIAQPYIRYYVIDKVIVAITNR